MTSTIALGDAKARLSAVVRQVKVADARFIITVRGIPSAMIVPIPKAAPTQPHSRGILANRKPIADRAEESAAYREALEQKYAYPA